MIPMVVEVQVRLVVELTLLEENAAELHVKLEISLLFCLGPGENEKRYIEFESRPGEFL